MEMRMFKWCLGLVFGSAFAVSGFAQEPETDVEPAPQVAQEITPALENRLIMELEDGLVTIDLRPDLAPAHIERIKALVRQNFYDGLTFHRVVDGFMAQTGDPTGTGMGGSSLPDLPAEFSDGRFSRGVVGMARGQSRNSANSQFFIMVGEGRWLEGEHTIVGRVVEGIEVIDQLRKGTKADNGLVKKPDTMIALRLVADIERRKRKAAETAVLAQNASDLADRRAAEAVAASQQADEARAKTEAMTTSFIAAGEVADEKRQIAKVAKNAVDVSRQEKQTADAAVVETGLRLTKAESELINAFAQAAERTSFAENALLQRDSATQASEVSDQVVVDAEATLEEAIERLADLEIAAAEAAAAKVEADEVLLQAKQVMASIDVDGGKANSRQALGEFAIKIAKEKNAEAKFSLERDASAIAEEIQEFSKLAAEDALQSVADAEQLILETSEALDAARGAETEATAAQLSAESELKAAVAARQSAKDILEIQKSLDLEKAAAARKEAARIAEIAEKAAAEAAAREAAEQAELSGDPANGTPQIPAEVTIDQAAETAEPAPIEIEPETSEAVLALMAQLQAAIEAENDARLELASREVALEKAKESVQLASLALEVARQDLIAANASVLSTKVALDKAETQALQARDAFETAEAEFQIASNERTEAQAIGDAADAERAKINAEFSAASDAVDAADLVSKETTQTLSEADTAVVNAKERLEQAQLSLEKAIAKAASQQAAAENAISTKDGADEAVIGAENKVAEAQDLIENLQAELADKEEIARSAASRLLKDEEDLAAAISERENAISLEQLAEVAMIGAQDALDRARSALREANDARDTTAQAALRRFSEAATAAAASAADVPLSQR